MVVGLEVGRCLLRFWRWLLIMMLSFGVFCSFMSILFVVRMLMVFFFFLCILVFIMVGFWVMMSELMFMFSWSFGFWSSFFWLFVWVVF